MSDSLILIREAARKAGKEVLRLIEEGYGDEVLGVGASGDNTLLLDKISENIIVDVISNRLVSFKILSEELGILNKGNSLLFVVDPVDGSFNSKRGIPLFTVSIALAKGPTFEDIVAGVVYDPYTDFLFWAEKGKGAYLNDKKLKVRETGRINGSVICVSSPIKAGVGPVKVMETIIRRGGRIRTLGSASYEACLVAKGAADGYVDAWGTLRVVDIAAASLILREAGAKLVYDYKRPERIPKLDLDERLYFIAASSE
ncbi:MAG: hypothetical protein DRJ41_03270, partial [Thermoprotei archaeon]